MSDQSLSSVEYVVSIVSINGMAASVTLRAVGSMLSHSILTFAHVWGLVIVVSQVVDDAVQAGHEGKPYMIDFCLAMVCWIC